MCRNTSQLGETPAKWEATDRGDKSTFVSMKPLDFKKTDGGTFTSHVSGNKGGYVINARHLRQHFNICKRETTGYFLKRCQNISQPCKWQQCWVINKCLGQEQLHISWRRLDNFQPWNWHLRELIKRDRCSRWHFKISKHETTGYS